MKFGSEFGSFGHVGHGLVDLGTATDAAPFTAVISGLTGGIALVGTQLSVTSSIVPDAVSWLANGVEFSSAAAPTVGSTENGKGIACDVTFAVATVRTTLVLCAYPIAVIAALPPQNLTEGVAMAPLDVSQYVTGSAVTLTFVGLPDGLVFDGTALSGTPTQSGLIDAQLIASNSGGSPSGVMPFDVAAVVGSTPPALTFEITGGPYIDQDTVADITTLLTTVTPGVPPLDNGTPTIEVNGVPRGDAWVLAMDDIVRARFTATHVAVPAGVDILSAPITVTAVAPVVGISITGGPYVEGALLSTVTFDLVGDDSGDPIAGSQNLVFEIDGTERPTSFALSLGESIRMRFTATHPTGAINVLSAELVVTAATVAPVLVHNSFDDTTNDWDIDTDTPSQGSYHWARTLQSETGLDADGVGGWTGGAVIESGSVAVGAGGVPFDVPTTGDGAFRIHLYQRIGTEDSNVLANDFTDDNTGPVATISTVLTSDGQLTVNWTTNEANGTGFIVLLADGSAVPDADQIAAGTDGVDTPAIQTGSAAVAATGAQTAFVFSGLTNGTVYDVAFVHRDTHDNDSGVDTDTGTPSAVSNRWDDPAALFSFISADALHSGTTFTSWVDKTSNAHVAAQSGTIPLPTYNTTNDSIEFDGTQALEIDLNVNTDGASGVLANGGEVVVFLVVEGAMTTQGEFTVWAEGEADAPGDNRLFHAHVFHQPAAGGSTWIRVKNRQFSNAFDDQGLQDDTEVASSTKCLIEIRVDQTTETVFLNGTQISTNAVTAANFSAGTGKLYLGGFVQGDAVFRGWVGAIHEATVVGNLANANTYRTEIQTLHGI